MSGGGFGSATSSSFTVTPAAATHLVVAAEPPSSVAAGGHFGLTVDAEDAFGNLVGGYSGSVTLSLAGGPGAALGGTLSAAASDGVASFSGLSIDRAGTDFTIEASAAGLTTATTGSFAVTPAAPAQLILQGGPPSSVTAGAPLGLAVAVEDVYGNVETGYGGDVTLGLAGGPAGAVLGGVTDEPATGGVATFFGLALTTAGTGYEIDASGGGLTDARSGSFEVAPAAPAQLVVTQPPRRPLLPGSPFDFGVSVEDAFGNVVSNSDAEVALNMLGGASGTTLGGTTTAIASGGVATFGGVTLGRVGSPFQIEASSPGLAGAITVDLSVTPTAPTQLAITLEPPASVTAGSGFGLGVSVEDATDANLTKTGKPYAVTITSSGVTPAATSVFNVIKPAVAGGPAAVRRSSRFPRRRDTHASGHPSRTAHDRSADRPAARDERGPHVRR